MTVAGTVMNGGSYQKKKMRHTSSFFCVNSYISLPFYLYLLYDRARIQRCLYIGQRSDIYAFKH